MEITFFPWLRRMSRTLRVVWLLPQPVLIATTATTGTLDLSMVRLGPIRTKSAPHELTNADFSIT